MAIYEHREYQNTFENLGKKRKKIGEGEISPTK